MAFTSALWDHAHREDSMLYEWAEMAERGAVENVVREISRQAGGVDLAQRR
jgi:hypothetical protein